MEMQACFAFPYRIDVLMDRGAWRNRLGEYGKPVRSLYDQSVPDDNDEDDMKTVFVFMG